MRYQADLPLRVHGSPCYSCLHRGACVYDGTEDAAECDHHEPDPQDPIDRITHSFRMVADSEARRVEALEEIVSTVGRAYGPQTQCRTCRGSIECLRHWKLGYDPYGPCKYTPSQWRPFVETAKGEEDPNGLDP